MKLALFAPLFFVAGLLGATPVMAKTLAYPNAEEASFLIDHPSDWEVEPGDDVGDYVTLTGPTGVVLQLRTIEGDESAIEQAIEDTADYIRKTFSNVELGESEELEHRGLTGFYVSGGGVDKEAGAVGFSMSFYALNDGNIAEIWFVVVAGDDDGAKQAAKVLDSFRAP